MRLDGQNSTSGTDHSMMRELNRSLVLDTVKRHGPLSRAAIAREASLAKPTVSAIVEKLIAEGLVRETGMGPTAAVGGRPPILLEFNNRSQFIVGIQFAVRHTSIVVADASGQELDRSHIETPSGPANLTIKAVVAEAKRLLKRAGAPRNRLSAVGVCVPGLIDLHDGTCLLAPNLGWRDVPVRKLVHAELRAPVYVVNTADAALVVESLDGAAQGAENAVLLYVGRGVGASAMLDGRLVRGSFGLTGEIGHCHIPGAKTTCNCGKIGCLETLADGRAIARAAVEAMGSGRESLLSKLPKGQLTAKDVAEAANSGDALATEVLNHAGRTLGIAASWLVNLFNPEVLLVGGAVAEAGEPLIGPLREATLEHALAQAAERVRISTWTPGRDAGVTGAVLVALQNSEAYYRVIFQG